MDTDKQTVAAEKDKKTETSAFHATSHKEDVTDAKHTHQLFPKKLAIALLLLIAIAVGVIALKTYLQLNKPQVKKITINKQVLQKRSQDLGLISRGLTGKAIDVSTGRIVKAARIFSPDDKTVYLELDLNSAPKGTIVDYIRYKEGRYVDHGEVTIANTDIKNLLFNWTITRLLGSSRDGRWKITTYSNGILAKRIAYEIRGNKVSYVYPDKPISTTDPDYKLSSIIALQSRTD